MLLPTTLMLYDYSTMSHRAVTTACSKRMKEGCPSSGSVPFAVFKCKVTKNYWNKQEKREVSFLKPLFTLC